MIHLFKKVYVSSDNLIDVDFDRVVVSEKNGVDMLQKLDEVSNGILLEKCKNFDALIGTDKVFSDWISFFKMLDDYQTQSNKKIMIYCDDKSMMKLLSAWFKILLPNNTKQSIESLINSYTFKYNVFYKGRYSTNTGNSDYNFVIDNSSFSEEYDSIGTISKNEFTDEIKPYVGIEFLLASYLKNESFKQELKQIMKVLIKKDMEKYLYELKEIFFVHITTKKFTNLLSLKKNYTFENFTTIEKDESKFVDLFTNDRIWSYKYMTHPSSSKNNINLEAITVGDKEAFKEFTNYAGATWNEENIYSFVKSDVNKLDFLDCFTNFTDDLLKKIIDTEASFEHAAGSFFSIDLESVNSYLISYLLEAYNDKDQQFIDKYSLV